MSDCEKLATITNQQEWEAYKKLFEQENKQRGIDAKPLPELRPQPIASQELDIVIQKAFDLCVTD